MMRQVRRVQQAGFSLPVVIILGCVLLTLSLSVAIMVRKDLFWSVKSRVWGESFECGDAAINRAVSVLDHQWEEVDGGGMISGYNCLTCSADAFTDVPGVAYQISICAGALANTTNAVLPPHQWGNTGDLKYDRTIFVRVDEANTHKVTSFYSIVHREQQCVALFSGPIIAQGDIDYGTAIPVAVDSYSGTTAAYGGSNVSNVTQTVRAGGRIVGQVPTYYVSPGSKICMPSYSAPGSACPLPGYTQTTSNATLALGPVPPAEYFAALPQTVRVPVRHALVGLGLGLLGLAENAQATAGITGLTVSPSTATAGGIVTVSFTVTTDSGGTVFGDIQMAADATGTYLSDCYYDNNGAHTPPVSAGHQGGSFGTTGTVVTKTITLPTNYSGTMYVIVHVGDWYINNYDWGLQCSATASKAFTVTGATGPTNTPTLQPSSTLTAAAIATQTQSAVAATQTQTSLAATQTKSAVIATQTATAMQATLTQSAVIATQTATVLRGTLTQTAVMATQTAAAVTQGYKDTQTVVAATQTALAGGSTYTLTYVMGQTQTAAKTQTQVAGTKTQTAIYATQTAAMLNQTYGFQATQTAAAATATYVAGQGNATQTVVAGTVTAGYRQSQTAIVFGQTQTALQQTAVVQTATAVQFGVYQTQTAVVKTGLNTAACVFAPIATFATPPTATVTPMPTATASLMSLPCIAGAMQAVNGCAWTQSGSNTDSYSFSTPPGAGHQGNVISSSTSCVSNGNINYGTIDGKTMTATSTATPVQTPAGLVNYGGVNLNSGSMTLTPGHYTGATVGGVLILSAGDYIFDSLNMNSGASLIANGAVHIWIINAFSPSGDMKPASNNPQDLWIFYNGSSDLNVNSGSTLVGVIYAPLAMVNTNYTVYGAIVGREARLNSGGTVHYDEDLGYNGGQGCNPATATPAIYTATITPTPIYNCPGLWDSSRKVMHLGPNPSNNACLMVYEVNDLTINNGTSLHVDVSNGDVALFVTGSLTVNGTGSIHTCNGVNSTATACPASNLNYKSSKFKVYVLGSGTAVNLSADGSYTMALMAPERDVVMSGTGPGDFFGAIMCKTFTRTGGATAWHYDLDLFNQRKDTYYNQPFITHKWRECKLPQ